MSQWVNIIILVMSGVFLSLRLVLLVAGDRTQANVVWSIAWSTMTALYVWMVFA